MAGEGLLYTASLSFSCGNNTFGVTLKATQTVSVCLCVLRKNYMCALGAKVMGSWTKVCYSPSKWECFLPSVFMLSVDGISLSNWSHFPAWLSSGCNVECLGLLQSQGDVLFWQAAVDSECQHASWCTVTLEMPIALPLASLILLSWGLALSMPCMRYLCTRFSEGCRLTIWLCRQSMCECITLSLSWLEASSCLVFLIHARRCHLA